MRPSAANRKLTGALRPVKTVVSVNPEGRVAADEASAPTSATAAETATASAATIPPALPVILFLTASSLLLLPSSKY